MELVEALTRPEAYPHPADTVEVHETHISWVFLAGDRAYKVKKPVRFPFLDYSTPEKRHHFCEEEVRLNRRLAPDTYLGVVPIDASFRVEGPGPAIEHAVAMVRLPHDRMLDELLRKGEAGDADVFRVADTLAAFHRDAAPAPQHGSFEEHRRRLRGNLKAWRPYLPPAWHARLERDLARALADARDRLERRRSEGFVRDVHGDLHAANVCLPEGGPVVVYDCIEFDPALRCVDLASESGFLAMDLEAHGAWRLARTFVERWTERTGDADARALRPLFKATLAGVRGLVHSLRDADDPRGRAYFRLAVSYGLGPFLVVVGGLPGTGKTHFARQVARAFDAVHLRSDVIRKELCGMQPTEHWGGGFAEGPYAPDVTERTYAALRDRARAALAEGRRVVVDATFGGAERHAPMLDAARAAGVEARFVLVEAPEDVVRRRMEQRAHDRTEVSDATFDVYRRAKERFEPPEAPCTKHDGTAAPEATLDKLVTSLL